jgi:hypothetical protein
VGIQGGNKFSYQRVTLKMNNAIRPCNSIKINIIDKENKKQIMMLPETILSNLLNLLSQQRNKQICCYDFVSILFNKFKMIGYFNIFDWVISNEYQAGDAVALRSNLINFLGYNYEHYAVYLGEDIYMSILGKGNCIHFTTLEEMKKLYKDTEVVGLKLITPKKEII